jgi:hypothetical protein
MENKAATNMLEALALTANAGAYTSHSVRRSRF